MITEPLFKKYYKTLIHFAGKIVPEDECHDIVIEVMIRVPVDGYDEKQTSRYLYNGVKMGCIDWLRAEKRHDSSYKELAYLVGDVELQIETSIVETITLADMLNAINQMAPKTRQVMQRVIKGETSQQIAAQMGIKSRTVINLRTWGRNHIRNMIESGKKLTETYNRLKATEGATYQQLKYREKARLKGRQQKEQLLAIG